MKNSSIKTLTIKYFVINFKEIIINRIDFTKNLLENLLSTTYY